MATSVTIRPDMLLPMRTMRGIEYVQASDTYTITLKGLSADEVRVVGESLQRGGALDLPIEQAANRAPEDPPLPAAFQRRMEIEE